MLFCLLRASRFKSGFARRGFQAELLLAVWNGDARLASLGWNGGPARRMVRRLTPFAWDVVDPVPAVRSSVCRGSERSPAHAVHLGMRICARSRCSSIFFAILAPLKHMTMLRIAFPAMWLLTAALAFSTPSVAQHPEGTQAWDLAASDMYEGGPRFRGGDMTSFRRWVIAQLAFPERVYTEGERIRLVADFRLTKRGKTKEVELSIPSDDPVVKQVLAAIGRADGWTPGRSGRMPDEKLTLALDLLLREHSDGSLYADDCLVYNRADTLPRFEGGDLNVFRKWVAERVGATWPDGSPVEGRIVARFVIEKDGSMTGMDITLETGSERVLAERVVEVLAAAPRWSPALIGGEPVRMRASVAFRFGAAADSTGLSDDEVYSIAERMPQFAGGDLSVFRKWVQANLKYPAEAGSQQIQGRVLVSFVVERDGSVTHIQVGQTPHPILSDAVVEALSRAPKWTPGMQDGRIVRVKYVLPVDFL